MRYRCVTHGTVLTVEGNTRTVTVPPIGPESSAVPRCALLTARNPRPGLLPVRDANGFNTGEYCEIQAVGE